MIGKWFQYSYAKEHDAISEKIGFGVLTNNDQSQLTQRQRRIERLAWYGIIKQGAVYSTAKRNSNLPLLF